MARFLIKRILNMIPLLIGITFLSFFVMSLVPGNFLSNLKMNPAISPQLIKEMEAQFGLNQPLLVRYGKWLWAVLHLSLGTSLAFNVSVTSLIGSRAVNTIILSAASMLFAWMIAIPIGIVVAVKQNSIWDRILSFLAFFGMSVPNFFLAFLMMYFAWSPDPFFGITSDGRSRWAAPIRSTTRSWTGSTKSATASIICCSRFSSSASPGWRR